MKRAPFNIANFDENPFELLDKGLMLATQPLHLNPLQPASPASAG